MTKQEPLHIPWLINIIGLWRFRNFVTWLSKVCGIQCSGKYRWKYANFYCQLPMGHTGTCIDCDGEEFRKWDSTSAV